MNPLFNANGEQIPARPTWKNNKETIIKMAMDTLFAEEHCDFEERERFPLMQTLLKQVSKPYDEYDLGEDFESDGWLVDSGFLSKLDNAIGHIQFASRNLEKIWYEKYKPIPPLNIGDTVFALHEAGVVTGICELIPAYFLVKTPQCRENSRILVMFELANKVGC